MILLALVLGPRFLRILEQGMSDDAVFRARFCSELEAASSISLYRCGVAATKPPSRSMGLLAIGFSASKRISGCSVAAALNSFRGPPIILT